MAEEASMTVVARADGFGSGLKDSLVAYLKEKGIEVEDLGKDKYYSIAVKVALELAKEKKSSSQGKPLSRICCIPKFEASSAHQQYAGHIHCVLSMSRKPYSLSRDHAF